MAGHRLYTGSPALVAVQQFQHHTTRHRRIRVWLGASPFPKTMADPMNDTNGSRPSRENRSTVPASWLRSQLLVFSSQRFSQCGSADSEGSRNRVRIVTTPGPDLAIDQSPAPTTFSGSVSWP